MNLFTIPPHAPFLPSLAAEWLDAAGHDPERVGDGLILLPTRRAARALADVFLRQSGGRALLLPRIVAIGALDEAPLALDRALDLPPAVDEARRLAVLTRLILAREGHRGAPVTADRAWLLARELASLMDEAERAGIDLGRALPDAADADFAEHWRQTLEFLSIVTAAWPQWLEAEGLMNPAARQAALLDAQARAFSTQPPAHRVVAAGMTGTFPALDRLLAAVARLPAGAVVLPGLDRAMDDSAWDAIGPSHPQAGLRALLDRLDARRDDVRDWPLLVPPVVPASRAKFLSDALLPAESLSAWQSAAAPDTTETPLISVLRAPDQQAEAAAIALVLRDALEQPGERAALVTPDRDLAARVAAELLRFGVVADDSAGEDLADTPPAVFLRLLARAADEAFAPVPLAALLKHPLAACGMSPAACRAEARALEIACLRGPRPLPGIDGLRRAADRARGAPRTLVEALERGMEPLLRVLAPREARPDAMLSALVQSAEFLAATDALPGPARLWAGEEGEALAEALAAAIDAAGVLPGQPPDILPGLLDAVLDGAVVRTRRALRGREAGAREHPRVFIWGLLEQRLQSAETIVLGGLAEGVWPPLTDSGPWMSRPMRERAGLPSPEERVGQAAHDFTAAACAARRVILSSPGRRNGAPAVPSRWLARMDAYLAGAGASLATHPAAEWARALDQPAGPPVPVRPPAPRPALHLRPRSLSVTEIETWLRDPYAIHAKHILRLEPLEPLDDESDAADYGRVVHQGLAAFLREHGAAWPDDASDRIRRVMERALAELSPRPLLRAWWTPRVGRVAGWVAEHEAIRRAAAPPEQVFAELRGEWILRRPGGEFRLIGRADRIERRRDGRLAILDYKTGTPPSGTDVIKGLAPQLPLEACMAAAGAFPEVEGDTAALIYWRLGGGFTPGQETELFRGKPDQLAGVIADAREKLADLIDQFDRASQPYLSHPNPGHAPRFADYAQLARVAEWAAAGDAE